MKKNNVFGFCLVLLLPLVLQAAVAGEGGMSGGGGRTLKGRPAEVPLDPEFVEDEIKSSYPVAIEYLENLKRRMQAGQLDPSHAALASKAFTAQADILTVSKTVRSKVVEHSPCYDFGGNPVDGSVIPGSPVRICISAKTFAEKVHVSEIKSQAVALMIHEFSEITGFSEPEAVALQTYAFGDLQGGN